MKRIRFCSAKKYQRWFLGKYRTSMLPSYANYLDEIAEKLEEVYDEKVLVNIASSKRSVVN